MTRRRVMQTGYQSSVYSRVDRTRDRFLSQYTEPILINGLRSGTRRATCTHPTSPLCISTKAKRISTAATSGMAQGPPSDTQEMANPDPACVVWKISQGKYKFFFEQVFGAGSLGINLPSDGPTACRLRTVALVRT